MQTNQVIAGLRQAVGLIETLSPIGAGLGVPGLKSVANIANAVIDIGENTLRLATDGAVVMTSDDADTIRSLTLRLAGQNDALNAKIAAM